MHNSRSATSYPRATALLEAIVQPPVLFAIYLGAALLAAALA